MAWAKALPATQNSSATRDPEKLVGKALAIRKMDGYPDLPSLNHAAPVRLDRGERSVEPRRYRSSKDAPERFH